eukprot:COSAG01_NODE_60346_length_295_cov_0.836735_1_plen_31_part_10
MYELQSAALFPTSTAYLQYSSSCAAGAQHSC